MHATIQKFISLYEKREPIQALCYLFSTPNLSYDEIQETSFDFALLNYADALCFGTSLAIEQTSTYLRQVNKEFDALQKELEWDETQYIIEKSPTLPRGWKDQKEAMIYWPYALEKKGVVLPPDQLQLVIQKLPVYWHENFKQQLYFSQNIITFSTQKPKRYQELLNQSHGLFRPIYPIHFGPLEFEKPSEQSIPAFFLDPHNIDWRSLFAPYQDKPALFLFWDPAILQQCLQFPDVLDALLDPKHEMLILNHFPPNDFPAWINEPMEPCLITRNPRVHEAAENIIKEIRGLPKSADSLYQRGLDLHFASHFDRLGTSRYFCQLKQFQNLARLDPHLNGKQASIDLMPSILDDREQMQKRKMKSKKPKLCHVVAQLVDKGDIPSAIVRTILKKLTRNKYELLVYVSEYFVNRPMDYPVSDISSVQSQVRAPQLLEDLSSLDVKVTVDDAQISLQDTAERLASWLKKEEVDIAIFHGTNPMHLLAARLSDVPLKVYYGHGDIPPPSLFDAYILSNENTQQQLGDYPSIILPFPIAPEETWGEELSNLSEFNLPKNAQIMTTISNHLENQISDEMIKAIAEICKQCPDAYYIPIGAISDPDQLLERFIREGIGDRLRIAGHVLAPSQLARSMHLYLNTFPFGGGDAIQDAMAAGCPVVTMYDEEGPGDVQEYVNLAVRLLQDKEMYAEWSEIAKEMYRKHGKITEYMKQFEDALNEWSTFS